MKKHLLLVLMALLGILTTANAANLLKDPGFENHATDWTTWGGDVTDKDNVHKGKYSAHSKGRGSIVYLLYQQVSVAKNTNYRFGGSMYRKSMDGLVYIDITNTSFARLSDQLFCSTANEWNNARGTWNSGDNETIFLRCIIEGNITEDIWFDDAFLEPAEYSNPVTLKYVNNKDDWYKITAHMWGGNVSGTTWPGWWMVQTDETCLGKRVYEITMNSGDYEKCIFSKNGESQLGDWSLNESKPVYYDGKSYASLEEVEEAARATGWYLRGTFNNQGSDDPGWGESGQKAFLRAQGDYSGKVGSLTAHLLGNVTYEFKAYNGSNWYGKNSTTITQTTADIDLHQSQNDNLKVKTTIEGDYLFSFNTDTRYLSITYPVAYTVSVSAGDGGSVEPSGDVQVSGSGVAISATPAAGYGFLNWSVTGGAAVADASSASTTLTATAAGTATANFEAQTSYTIEAKATTGGSIEGTSKYTDQPEGATQSFTASEPQTGYQFDGWTATNEAVISAPDELTTSITIGAFSTVATANYLEILSTISVSASEGGSVDQSSVNVGVATSAQITATPNSGYKFKEWTLTNATLASGSLTDATISIKADGSGEAGTAVASFETDPNVVTLYFVNSIEWSKVNAYLYNDEIKGWPGLEMTKTSMTATSYNYEVWSISFDKNSHTNIIFNNGDGKQTPASMELWNAEKPYYDYNNNAWYASLDDIVPVVPQAHKVFVRGGFNGWDDSFQLKSATGDGVFEGTISWNKNQTYNFKLTVDNEWKSVDKTINETGAFEIPNDGGDMKVATNEYEGDFKFSYDYSSKILTVTYPTDEKVTILVSSDDTDKGTVDKESVEVGKYSTATITALPESGYKLSTWTLTNAVLASGSLTDAAITIKSDGSGLDGTAVASFVEDPDAVVVKYLNTNNWEPVYIHMWGAKETQWHGLPMKNTGEQKYGYDVYSITINKNDYKSCIFNDNGDNKSRNLVFGKDDAQYEPDYSKLVCSQGKWYASLEDVPEPTFQTFYYVNRYNWETPKIYFYGGDGYGSFTSYPGVDMLKQDGVSVNGCDVYYYNVEEGLFQSYVIGQGTDEDKYEATIDPENLVYYYKGVRFNKLEDIKPLTLVGEFNEWDASANKLEMEDNIGFTSVVLSANKTYKFKILDNGIYLSNSGTMTSDNCTGWTMETDKGDCNIETKNKGEFTFSFDVKTSKLSVTYPEMVTGYSMIINGIDEVVLTKQSDKEEYYVIDQMLQNGDVLTFKNLYSEDFVTIKSIDGYSIQNVAGLTEGSVAFVQEGEYDLYFTPEYDNDKLYIGGEAYLDEKSDNAFLANDGVLGQTIDLKVDRPLSSAYYNTICLPFSLSATQIASSPLAGAVIAKYNNATIKGSGATMEATLNFVYVDNIEAGVPYIIQPAADITGVETYYGVTVSETEGSSISDGVIKNIGFFKPKELQKDDFNSLFLGAGNVLYWPNVTGSMKGLRAYFNVLLAQMVKVKAPSKLQVMAPLPTDGNDPAADVAKETYKTFNEENIVVIVRPDGTMNTIDGKEVK